LRIKLRSGMGRIPVRFRVSAAPVRKEQETGHQHDYKIRDSPVMQGDIGVLGGRKR
jgi:hypothetical protein